MKSVIKEYKIDENFDKRLFEYDDEKLRKHGLTYMNTYSSGIDYISFFHHDNGVSLIVDTEIKRLVYFGLEDAIAKTKKDLEPLIGNLKEK